MAEHGDRKHADFCAREYDEDEQDGPCWGPLIAEGAIAAYLLETPHGVRIFFTEIPKGTMLIPQEAADWALRVLRAARQAGAIIPESLVA